MAQPKETRSYICSARWEYRGEVIIEASSPEEAAEKFEAFQDVEFQDSGAEIINWERDGEIRPNE